jgi:hypothetical protein
MKNYDELMSKYPILFQQNKYSEMETCMCWGICCDIGWYDNLDELCSVLEELNNKYRGIGISIQATQVKEKFGGLRFYFQTHIKNSIHRRIFAKIFKYIRLFIERNIDFEYKKVIDKESYIENKWKEISKEDFENKVTPYTWDKFEFKEEDGHYYLGTPISYSEVSHLEPTKHLILYSVRELINKIIVRVENQIHSSKKIEIANKLYKIASALIDETEQKCWNTCEKCGKYDFSGENIYSTEGWITRLCSDCFEERENNKEDTIINFSGSFEKYNMFNENTFEFNGIWYSSIWKAYYYNLFKKDWMKKLFSVSKGVSSYYYYYLGKTLKEQEKISDSEKLMKEIIKSKYKDCSFENIKDKNIIYKNNICENYWGWCSCKECTKTRSYNKLGKIINEIKNGR